MSVKSVSIRIEEEMLRKLGYIADYEGRSVNSHVLVLIRDNIKAFEQMYGKIDGNIQPDINVKPVSYTHLDVYKRQRVTGACAVHQRQLTVAIKRARQVALLPYISD